jgi:hypoxanthine-DNA glycosylase
LIYSFAPVYNADSVILILGTMASLKSLEKGFYYMHPQNKFWRVMSEICGERKIPEDTESKTKMLLEKGIALSDILVSCERAGSLDSAIKNYTVRDIPAILSETKIKRIFCNGRTSFNISKKNYPNLEFNYLPSTSPANAAHFNIDEWLKLKEFL